MISLQNNFLIIAGGGKFGKIALNFAIKNNYIAIIIDINPNCQVSKFSNKTFKDFKEFKSKIKELNNGDICFLNQDVSIILELIMYLKPEYVIPVVPIHLMASIINSFLINNNLISLIPNKNLTEDFINNANPNLILNSNLEQGIVYLSYAKINEICPDNCSGPLNYCPNFKRDKPMTITSYLRDYFNVLNIVNVELNEFYNIFIISESYQLMPGLGGLKGKDINFIFEKLNKNLNVLLNQKCNVIVATTCNCHGVINFYKN